MLENPPDRNDSASAESVAFSALSTDRALAKIKRSGIEIATVIDVGASNGMWSAVCEKHFPDADYLLIDAQNVHEPALREYCRSRRNAQFLTAAAGDALGSVYFDDHTPFGGVASKDKTDFAYTEVKQTTVDHEIRERRLSAPYLLKLDTHGYEVPILEGASEIVLKHASLLVIECYNFRILPRSLLFHEMISYLRERGFGVIDASEPLWRPRDGAFWQFDLFFTRLDRPEFGVNTYT